MDLIGTQNIWAFFDEDKSPRPASNWNIRHQRGHTVQSYFELAKKVAQLQFLNRDYFFLFRGQKLDSKSIRGNTTLKPCILRIFHGKKPSAAVVTTRFSSLRKLESKLVWKY